MLNHKYVTPYFSEMKMKFFAIILEKPEIWQIMNHFIKHKVLFSDPCSII